jgi:hypothetical protein
MQTLMMLLVSAFSAFMMWRLYQTFKANPQLLSKENISKSFATMGVIALLLIGFVATLVMLIR